MHKQQHSSKIQNAYKNQQSWSEKYAFLYGSTFLFGEFFIISLFILIWRIKIKNDYRKQPWSCHDGICDKKEHVHTLSAFKLKKRNKIKISWQDSFLSNLLFQDPIIDIKDECKTMDIIIGEHLDYEIFSKLAKPFDSIFLRNPNIVGKVIRETQAITREKCKLFSHVVTLLNTTVIKLDGMIDGEWYVIESTVTNLLPNYDNVKNIGGKLFSGVQIRSLREQLSVRGNESTLYMWCPLKPQMRKIIEQNYDAKIYKQMIINLLGKNYTTNVMNFFTAFWPSALDWIRQFTGSAPGSTYYCSELVCAMYQQQGIIDPQVESKYIFPADLFDIKKINPPIFYKLYPLKFITDEKQKKIPNKK